MDKSILEGKVRNIDIEEYAVDMVVKKSCGYVSHDEIKEFLRKNDFNGIYVLTSKEFHEVEDDENALGLYNHDFHVVLLDGEAFIKQPDIAIHEIIHAFLGRRGCRLIYIDSNKVNYGYGLEEGFAALMQRVYYIDAINHCKVNSYPYQASIFKQLNVLYEYCDSKKHPSLMHLILKEPDSFLHTLSEIYASILRKIVNDGEFVSLMSMKIAFAVVSSTDAMIDLNNEDTIDLYRFVCSFNTVSLALANKKMRDGIENHELFPDLSLIAKTSEERLLNSIFGTETDYILKQLNYMEVLMIKHTEKMECISKDARSNNYKVKSR